MATPIDIQLFAEGNADPQSNGGNNAEPAGGNGAGGAKTYTQEELDNIVSERTGRATKSALSSFFKQKGLSEDEANSAISAYLDEKKKNTPDIGKLQSDIATANKAKLLAEINQSATLEAVKQGVDVKSIPYVLKMADFSEAANEDGTVNAEKLSEAVKKVLDDIPALKGSAKDNAGAGFGKIGGDGNQTTNTDEDKLRSIFGIKTK